MKRHLFILTAAGALMVAPQALAQPTYKLGVKPDLKPLASLQLDGTKVNRSEVADDPGFRLQYHIVKEGKTVVILDARANPTLELPQTEPGVYSVMLELFYPDYKTGNGQKGAFRPVSLPLLYLASKEGTGQPRIADLSAVDRHLFYGLQAGKMLPLPQTP